MRKIIFTVILLWSYAGFAATTVVDGDSLEIDGERIRLDGIDAPEYMQTCEDENAQKYACGQEAINQLQELIAGNDVRCECADNLDKYKRKICECFVGETSLNREMVVRGWARTYRSEKYITEENTATENKRGIWQGRHMRPALYRALEKYQTE